ncbi:MAG TPA: tetratricopeptide repeat protein [Pyrinomonadaceae bacterium]|jgi:tetratricopeptide (TPR) repeat protein
MKTLRVTAAFMFGAALCAAAFFGARPGVLSSVGGEAGGANVKAADTGPATPADLRIRAGEGKVKQSPQKPGGYNLLAAAYMQKERETGDFAYNARAQAALADSLRVAPDNYDAVKLRAKILLSHHRFADALAEARRAESLRPDDHDVYGALTDACVELGDYDCAVAAAQKMVDLRPDASSYARVAYLRALHGDNEGAAEAMRVAVKAADPRDPESVAWYRVHLGEELAHTGRRAEAEAEYDRALAVFPDYHIALAAKGRARAESGDFAEAARLFERAQSKAALPDVAAALGDVYARLGREEDARLQYAEVEKLSLAAGGGHHTFARHLALFWADRGTNLEAALKLAQHERSERADVFTEDALAWCLFKKGMLEDARASVERALRLGTRDARMLYHAGMIYDALGDRKKGRRYLSEALALNPSFDLVQAESARRALDGPRG